MKTKKRIIFLLSCTIILVNLFILNEANAESLQKHTPVSNNENLELIMPDVKSLDQEVLEVKPVTGEETTNNISTPVYEELIDGVLEEEVGSDITFPEDEGKLLNAIKTPKISTLSLIGTTDRRVQNTNTTIHPYNTIAYLYITFPDGTPTRGTGFIIDNNTVLTAGHCVYEEEHGGWATNITVRPGANGANNFPYGAFTSKNLYSVSGWTKDRDAYYDYGAINITGTFPSTIGSFGYGVATSSNFEGKFARITGYPANRTESPYEDIDKPLYTQWYHSGTINFPLLYPKLVNYATDTSGGQSGAPVYIPGENIARAIHTGVYKKGDSNRGTKITTEVYANIQNWAVN